MCLIVGPLAQASTGSGKLLLSQRRWAEAVVALKEEVAEYPEDLSRAEGLARALVFSGRRAEAIETLTRAAKQAKDPQVRASLEQKRKVIARVFAQNQTQEWFQKGVAEFDRGALREASDFWKKALAKEPDQLDALVRQGQAQALLGLWDSCAETLRESLRLSEEFAAIHAWLGYCLLKRGEKKEALELLSGAARKQPEDVAAQLLLLEARWQVAPRVESVTALVQAAESALKKEPSIGARLWVAKLVLQMHERVEGDSQELPSEETALSQAWKHLSKPEAKADEQDLAETGPDLRVLKPFSTLLGAAESERIKKRLSEDLEEKE